MNNNENEFESIIKILRNIKLSEEERHLMRTHLLEKIDLLQVAKSDNVTKRETNRLYYYYQNIKEHYFMNNKTKFVPAFIVIVIIAITGGTSAFAEKAVPGDLLYGVKISVNEKVAGVFALSKEEKTEWKERLVERRLKEAQKLVSRNDLDETTRINLENKIKNQVDEFNTSANELALEKDKSANSSDLNIRLQASLRAYQNILESLSGETDISTETKTETGKLVAVLEESKNKVKDNHENLESGEGQQSTPVASTNTQITSPASALALAKQKVAVNLLNSTKLLYQKEGVNLSTNIQNQINDKFAKAEVSIKEGEALIATSDFINATDKFQMVINGINTAKLLILSNVIKGDIEDDIGIDDDDGDIEDDDDMFEDDDRSSRLESNDSHSNENEEDEFEED